MAPLSVDIDNLNRGLVGDLVGLATGSVLHNDLRQNLFAVAYEYGAN